MILTAVTFRGHIFVVWLVDWRGMAKGPSADFFQNLGLHELEQSVPVSCSDRAQIDLMI